MVNASFKRLTAAIEENATAVRNMDPEHTEVTACEKSCLSLGIPMLITHIERGPGY